MQLYVVRPKVDKSKKEEKVLYYGVPVASGQVDADHLAWEISERCSLTAADVLATISALSDVMQHHLLIGNTVYLKGIGLFSVSASSSGCATPKECTPAKVTAQRVCFKADSIMRSILARMKYKFSERAKKKR
ncbi:MAG: HU family DNA-binding protein [Mediterranea sp.]|jgi:predicted histone-like DNA-binding protein|nr:HU family DNA-binding protein [Mediterranea sp.]